MTWLVPCSLLSDPILSGVGLLFRCWTTPRKHWRCWRLCYHRLECDWSCTKNHGVKDLDHHNGESFGTVTAATRPWAILGLENPGKESSPSKLDYIKSVTKCALLMAQRKAQGCSSAFKTVLPLECTVIMLESRKKQHDREGLCEHVKLDVGWDVIVLVVNRLNE